MQTSSFWLKLGVTNHGATVAPFIGRVGSAIYGHGDRAFAPRPAIVAKHEHFVPGTAQQIVPPQALQEVQPDLVIIMNSNYEQEIHTLLGDLDVQSETSVA